MTAVGRPSSEVFVPLAFGQRADVAAVEVLRSLYELIEANLHDTVADVDPECLHDLRVAVRRSRAVQRELKSVFPPAELRQFRSEFRWFQRATGELRDLDVHVLEFNSLRDLVPAELRDHLEPLRRLLRSRRAQAHEQLVDVLRSERVAMLLRDWGAFLGDLVGLPEDDRPDAATPIGALAGRRVLTVYKRIARRGGAIDSSSPAEAYHELRKQGKELRYLLELFAAPTHPREIVAPMVSALKCLQDVLGRHQDREVQVAMLGSARDQVGALPAGPAALMAMGALVVRLREDEQAARTEFRERFAAFAGKRQRKLVREAFG